MVRARVLVAPLLAVVIVGGCTTAPPGASELAPSAAPQPSAAVPSPVAPSSPTPAVAPSSTPSASAGASAVARSSPVPGAAWVPGTHVSMIAPTGFEPATEQAGFEDPASDAVIMVRELPGGPFDLTDQAYARSGLVVVDRAQTTVDGQSRIIVQGDQTLTDGTRVKAIVLSLGTSEVSTLIVANIPRTDADLHAAVLASLMTARFDQTRAIEPSLAMAFDVEPSAPLVLAASGGQGATYNTLGHLRHPLDAGIPTLQVFLVAEPPPEDMAAYLRAQIQRNGQQLFDAKVQLEAGLVIDGLDGFVVVASAQDALQLADRELVAFDALAPHPDGRRFAVMAGIATAEVSDELLPAFRETAESFRWRATP